MSRGRIINIRENEYLRLLKYKLWMDDPNCRYCGIETFLPNEQNAPKGKPLPPNAATIDHKYSKYDPLRNTEKQEYLLCCNLCNHYKNLIDESKVSIEELRERSRRGYRDGKPQVPYGETQQI